MAATASIAGTLAAVSALAGAAIQGGRCVRSICQPAPPKARRPAEERNKRKQQKESRRRNRR